MFRSPGVFLGYYKNPTGHGGDARQMAGCIPAMLATSTRRAISKLSTAPGM